MWLGKDTEPLIEGLVDLHDYGILTTNAQRGKYEKLNNVLCMYSDVGCRIAYPPPYDDCMPLDVASNDVERDWWFEQRQKAFLSFLLPTKDDKLDRIKVFHFADLLLERDDVSVAVHPFIDGCPTSIGSCTKNSTLWEHRYVTEARIARTEIALKHKSWDVQAYLHMNQDRYRRGGPHGAVHPFKNWTTSRGGISLTCVTNTAPIYFDVIAKFWNDTEFGLERIVRECLEQAGIKRAFKEF